MGAWIEISSFSNLACEPVSHPTMGAWIEMLQSLKYKSTPFSSHPTMGAWIEILLTYRKMMNAVRSHPTMGAWIEILIIPSIILYI